MQVSAHHVGPRMTLRGVRLSLCRRESTTEAPFRWDNRGFFGRGDLRSCQQLVDARRISWRRSRCLSRAPPSAKRQILITFRRSPTAGSRRCSWNPRGSSFGGIPYGTREYLGRRDQLGKRASASKNANRLPVNFSRERPLVIRGNSRASSSSWKKPRVFWIIERG